MAFNYTSSAIISTPDRIQFKSSTQRTACIDIPVFIALSKKNNYLLEKNTDIIRIREKYNKKNHGFPRTLNVKRMQNTRRAKNRKKEESICNVTRMQHLLKVG